MLLTLGLLAPVAALLQLPVDSAVAAPGTMVVTSTADAVDANPGNGQCATATGACTLRAAVQEANAVNDPDTIEVPAGTYVLGRLGAAEDAAATGDLDVTAPLTVVGAGAGRTIIDGNAQDRVLHVLVPVDTEQSVGDVTLTGLTLRDGSTAEQGGGVLSTTDGTLTLDAVTVTGNVSTSDGGGIHAATGRLHLRNGTVVSGNEARNGGGIFVAGALDAAGVPSVAVMTRSTIADNSALGGGGAVWVDHEGSLTLTDVDVTDNHSADMGGGVSVVSKSALTIHRGTFSGNRAHGEGGAVATATERAVRVTGTRFTDNHAGVPVAGAAGEGGGGAWSSGGSGVIEIAGGRFTENSASGEGGAIYLSNNGSVAITDSLVARNEAGAGGGGIENAASRVTLSGLTVRDNRAATDGGGIESQGSGAFTITHSTISNNTARNGGGFANAADGTTRVERSLFWDNRAISGAGSEETGLGGGIYSLGDAEAAYSNITITGNLGQARGGGFYVDADAGVRVTHATIVGNSSPIASGVGGEIGSVNFPVQPSLSVIFRNSIVAGNLLGPECSFAVGSEGGNLQGDTSCHFSGPKDRTVADAGLDAVADNGGPTMTMAIQPDSLALDAGVSPCAPTDQRGVTRPKNLLCDSGAYESEGPFPPADTEPPDTTYLTGPVQDTENTSAFTFTGSDNRTATGHLVFECRLIEHEPGEPPEPPDPTEPPDPAFAWLGCQDPWQVPLQEEGFFTFEVRAIDRAGNVDPTPAAHSYGGVADVTPPQTVLLDTPPDPSFSDSAAFTVTGTDDHTPAQFLEFECRIDTLDPEAWLECTNPLVYTNLSVGTHTVQARATDGADNVDPSPATYTWTVAPPTDCDLANSTVLANADVYVDQELAQENFAVEPQLAVRSGDLGTNARSLVRFPVSTDIPDCTLESATLRLYAGSSDPGRTLEAVPLAADWAENTATWVNQPATTGTPATAASGDGYREWDVAAHVDAILAGDLANNGWLIRDAAEGDALGAAQGFLSRETPQDPPGSTLPQLVLRFEASGTPPPPPPPPGQPATLACGDTVTESIVLQNDLRNCLREGLVVGASDIEIDLDGHTISGGLVLEPGEEVGLFAGIRNTTHDNVVIKNGTVRNFGYGVRVMAGARFNVVEGMTLDGNVAAGVELFDADDGRNGNTVRHNLFRNNGDGVVLTSGTEAALISGNTFERNVGRAVYVFDASRNRIADNTISGLQSDPLLDSDGGIFLEGSPGNVVIGNTVTDSGDSGILVGSGSHRTTVEGNTMSRTGDSGVDVADSDGTAVIDNVIHLAAGSAITLSNAHDGTVRSNDARFNPGGIALAGSNGNLVEDNDVRHSLGDGIVVESGLENVLRANDASGTRATGIVVAADAVDLEGNPIPGNIVEGNTAHNNLGSGIQVSAGGHEVTDNAAHDNGAWGIIAGELVVDGGGNVASGNAEAAQCSGVVCAAGSGVPPVGSDLTAPDTELLTTPADGGSMFDEQTFTFTGSDDTAPATALRFECRLDAPPDPAPEPPEPGEPPEPPASETWQECGNPWTYGLLTSGEHTFDVRAIDPFGNVDITPASYTWTVVGAAPDPDSTAPSTTIFEAPTDPSTSTTAAFAFRGSDNATPGTSLTFECSLDGGPFEACTSPAEYTALALGDHRFEVRAVDLQDNADPTPAARSWTIVEPDPDTTAPDTTLDSGPDLTTVSTDASFTFSSGEEGTTFECSLDGADFAECASPAEYGGLAVGEHTFAVRAVDAAGNLDATPATYDWTVGFPAVDAAVTCGQTVLQSIRVTNDLLDCLGDGLVIGADGITVDLGDHRIDGTSLGSGILNRGFDSVTITNGVVQEFDAGVALGNGTALGIVSDLDLRLNAVAGAQLTNADDGSRGSILRDNTISGNGDGVLLLSGTQHAHVLRNTIAGNAGLGIHVVGSSSNTLDRNELSGMSGAGVVFDGATDNTMVGNTVTTGGDAAVIIELGSHGNRIEGNELTETEAGIVVLQSNRNELVANIAHNMGDAGIVLEDAHDGLVKGNDVRFNSSGVELDLSTGNRIEGNNASESSGAGIEVADGSVRNVLVQNTANANEAGGIVVETFAAPGAGNLLDRNVTSDNTGDGIYVGNVGHMLVGNSAHDNTEWGIYAADPTAAGMNLDGGDNIASGNTGGEVDPNTQLPLQCKNVVCDGGPPKAVDRVAPTTAISVAPVSPTTATSATLRFTGSDNASAITFQCRLDSTDETDFSSCTSPQTYAGLAIGEHTFEVRAVDFSGNVDPTPATHTWTIVPPAAGVPPETTIDSGPDATTAATSASFTFSADEPDVTFECSLDGGAFGPCTSPQAYNGLGEGGHTFAVRAVDGEGNVDGTPATYSWLIAAPPVAAGVSCGQLITSSIRVTNDLTDCQGNGLVIGTGGIVLDLDGHTIDGTGIGVGILNAGRDSVVIRNGMIGEFDFGVQLGEGTAGNVVDGLSLHLNQDAGIQLVGADDGMTGNTVRDNTFIDNAYGVWLLDGTQYAVVRGNMVTSSSLDGIRAEGSNGNRVEANTVTESSGAGVALVSAHGNTVVDNTVTRSSGSGVAVGESGMPANGNRIEGNTITSSSGAGISVVDSTGNELVANTATLGGSSGIELDGASDTLLQANDVSGNAGGIELIESSDNRIEGNNASGSNGTGISLESSSLRNELVLNISGGNSGDGIYVNDSTDAANGNLIERNIASSNSGNGIIVNGSGHTVTANAANSNDGWGILAVSGTIDGGGNEAAGNAEPAQCSGVVCTVGTAPGAPDTEIVDRPADPSNSANALFTFIGADDTTSLFDLSFECRLDSSDPAAWVECDNPHEYFDLAPGTHTFEVRAVDLGGLVDPTPATYTWTYEALPSGTAPDTTIDMAPPLSSPLLDVQFTFSSNEPDVTFECSLDDQPYTTCAFGVEYSFEETEVGQHTFRVRATDPEGNTDPTPATYTWTIIGLTTTITAGPAYIPSTEPGVPAQGGETTSRTAVFEFEANVADATFLCSVDLGPFEPCTSPATYTDLPVGEHLFQVLASDAESEATQLESTEYEWTVTPSEDTLPPETTISSAPADGTSDTVFEFTGTDDQTQPEALTFECRLDSTDELAWVECLSPFNLLGQYPDLAPGEHTFEVRANDNAEPADPSSPFEGNLDPTPAVHTWTSVADTTAPATTLLTTPQTPTTEPDVEFTFAGSDNATPEPLLTFECALDGAAFEPCSSPASVQGLAPGEHTFAVRAVDLAGNPDAEPATHSWTLVGPPVTTIESGPADPSATRDATFAFSADQTEATYECALDGASPLPCTSPATYTGLTDGSHTFEVLATNSFGLTETEPASFTWTIEAPADTTAPDTSITASPAAVVLASEAHFEFASTEVGATFECSLDGAEFSGCGSPQELSGLADGMHTFAVRAIDAAGNADPSPATHEWMTDLPPVTEIDAAPAQVSEATSATFEFGANEFVAGFECFLDGAVEPCSSPVTYTGLALGPHTFGVRAVDDTASNPAEWTDHAWEVVAAAPPSTTITGGPAGDTFETAATFTFTGLDNATPEADLVFECSLDAAPFEDCTSPLEVTGLAVGDHRFEVRAVDANGAPDPSPAVSSWTVHGPDDTAPETTISSGPAATTTSSGATLAFTAGEPGATFECSLDGAPFGSCESPVTLTDLALGDHSFAVRATDLAGNTDATPAAHGWTVVADTTAPETTITAGPSGSSTAVDASFEFTGNDDTVPAAELSFECSLDGGPFEPCSSPEAVQGLAVGEHTFAVRAVDAALNVDPSPATRTWTTVDTVAPETTIETGPASPTEETTATFSFSADETGATFECSLDGEQFAACTSPAAIAGLAVGDHTFRVRAVDSSGNADPTADEHAWTVVSPEPPATTMTSGPPATTTATEASFTFASDQPGVTFECALDGAGFSECESPYEVTGLAVGPHELQVRAVDLTGKVDPTPATYAWTVESPVPPETTIVSAPDGTTELTTATFTFSSGDPAATFECSLDAAPYADCESPVELVDLAPGEHTFAVRALDVNGLADPTPAGHTWTVVEATPPPQCNLTTATYGANADSWINQGSPSENKGSDSNLKVMSKSGANLRALVRFGLPTQLPEGCVVQSATLRLYAGSYKSSRTIQALRVAAPWVENSVSWATQPATAGTAATTTSGSGWRQWSVTAHVQTMFGSGANHGFLIRDAVEGQDHEQQFHSREKAPDRPPQLVVTYGQE